MAGGVAGAMAGGICAVGNATVMRVRTIGAGGRANAFMCGRCSLVRDSARPWPGAAITQARANAVARPFSGRLAWIIRLIMFGSLLVIPPLPKAVFPEPQVKRSSVNIDPELSERNASTAPMTRV